MLRRPCGTQHRGQHRQTVRDRNGRPGDVGALCFGELARDCKTITGLRFVGLFVAQMILILVGERASLYRLANHDKNVLIQEEGAVP